MRNMCIHHICILPTTQPKIDFERHVDTQWPGRLTMTMDGSCIVSNNKVERAQIMPYAICHTFRDFDTFHNAASFLVWRLCRPGGKSKVCKNHGWCRLGTKAYQEKGAKLRVGGPSQMVEGGEYEIYSNLLCCV